MISTRKIEAEKARIVRECAKCRGVGCPVCMRYCQHIDHMASAQIPVDYWFRHMEDFYGSQEFKQEVMSYIENIEKEYSLGKVLCLSGHRGVGKTMAACSILQKAILKGYDVHYTTLVDAVSILTSYDSHMYRKSVRRWDFLVIDEVDQRYFDTINSRNLYGNHFENILRTRAQNRLPLIMCTNSEDLDAIFAGEFQESFRSLRSQFFRVLPVGGHDARKEEGKHGS